jgi:hypothetical protein
MLSHSCTADKLYRLVIPYIFFFFEILTRLAWAYSCWIVDCATRRQLLLAKPFATACSIVMPHRPD